MAESKRVQLEIKEDDEAFVRTLAEKLGWKVIGDCGSELTQDEGASEPGWRWKGGDEMHDVSDDTHDSTQQTQGAAGDNEEDSADLSCYSPAIQALRRGLYTKITAEDIASDPRLAYIMSK